MILNEMVHDARIVPTDGRPHIPQNVRQWRGDSRGHGEGDPLVVDTSNFTSKTTFRGSGSGMHLVERFTRVDADTLLYPMVTRTSENAAGPDAPQIILFENWLTERKRGIERRLVLGRARRRVGNFGERPASIVVCL